MDIDASISIVIKDIGRKYLICMKLYVIIKFLFVSNSWIFSFIANECICLKNMTLLGIN